MNYLLSVIILLSSNDNCAIRIDFDISISKFTRKNYSWVLLQVNSMLNVEGYNINLSYDKEFREEYKTINKEDLLSLFIDICIKLNHKFMSENITYEKTN
jgi:homospermidine synthase